MPTEHEPKYSQWLQTTNTAHSVDSYLNWISQEPNGVDAVFILNTGTGRLIARNNVAGAGGQVDLANIVAWTGANVARDTVQQLSGLLHGGELKYVDYTLERAIMRLFYVTTNNGNNVLIGFIGTQPTLMGTLDYCTPPFANKIRGYLH